MSSAAIDVATYSEAKADLKAVLDRATHDGVPVLISRSKGEHAVVISLDEWNSLQETNHLRLSPANAKRLDEAIAQANRGEAFEVEHGNYRPVDERLR